MRTDVLRVEIRRLLHAVPFRPFVLNMANGDRVVIEHAENMAFDPSDDGSGGGASDFYVTSRKLRLFSTFEAITSVAMLDEGL